MSAKDNSSPPLPYRCRTMLHGLTADEASAMSFAWEEQEQAFIDWVRAHPTPRLEWLQSVKRLTRRRAREAEILNLAGTPIVMLPRKRSGCGVGCYACKPPRGRDCANDPLRRPHWLYYHHPWRDAGVCPGCGLASHWGDLSMGYEEQVEYPDSIRCCEECGREATSRAWIEEEERRGGPQNCDGPRRRKPCVVIVFPVRGRS